MTKPYKPAKRKPHCSETCKSCADSHRIIGDRDEQIRKLSSRASAGDRAVEQLADVTRALDQAGVPTETGRPHERLTVAGRVRLIMGEPSIVSSCGVVFGFTPDLTGLSKTHYPPPKEDLDL